VSEVLCWRCYYRGSLPTVQAYQHCRTEHYRLCMLFVWCLKVTNIKQKVYTAASAPTQLNSRLQAVYAFCLVPESNKHQTESIHSCKRTNTAELNTTSCVCFLLGAKYLEASTKTKTQLQAHQQPCTAHTSRIPHFQFLLIASIFRYVCIVYVFISYSYDYKHACSAMMHNCTYLVHHTLCGCAWFEQAQHRIACCMSLKKKAHVITIARYHNCTYLVQLHVPGIKERTRYHNRTYLVHHTHSVGVHGSNRRSTA